jgi:hypothetical protein
MLSDVSRTRRISSRVLILLSAYFVLGGIFVSAIAHGWVLDSRGFWLAGFLFVSALTLAVLAIRCTLWAGPSFYGCLIVAIWFPPWVICSMKEMIIVTCASLVCAATWLLLLKKRKDKWS